MRFANGAANAIQAWTIRRGYSCEIEKIALEGEGKIAERVDILWKLLLNWMEDIRKADFIMIACHSQGVPVTMMLISKLIAFGCVSNTHIGVCAMAGVNLGPFGDYKSRWISGSAGELFDFAQADSQVSKAYETALGSALRFGVRVLYVGSIDDQLVSLEVSSRPLSTVSDDEWHGLLPPPRLGIHQKPLPPIKTSRKYTAFLASGLFWALLYCWGINSPRLRGIHMRLRGSTLTNY